MDGEKLEGAKKKSVTLYKLDFTKCSLCGSCVEACRDAAIRYSHAYNSASLNKEYFIMDLFAKLQAESQAAGVPPAAPAAPVKTEPVAPAQTQTPAPPAGGSQTLSAISPAATAPKSAPTTDAPVKNEPVKANAP